MFEHILAAKKRLKNHSNIKPIMTSRTLNHLIATEVFFKCENFLRIGVFKFRGDFNSISKLTGEEKAQSVITYSSGNHTEAVALVGQLLNVQTTVVVPGIPTVSNKPHLGDMLLERYKDRICQGFDDL